MSQIFFALGGILCLVAAVMIIIAAFRTSVLWGILCLVVPFCQLIFVVTHWQESKKAFVLYLVGIALVAIGAMTAS